MLIPGGLLLAVIQLTLARSGQVYLIHRHWSNLLMINHSRMVMMILLKSHKILHLQIKMEIMDKWIRVFSTPNQQYLQELMRALYSRHSLNLLGIQLLALQICTQTHILWG
nr:hypothetical protein Iba_chr12aCG23810 [Ipomoea batatas]